MRSRFPGFATVRIACGLCGWFRILGHTGSNGKVRALIRLTPDPATCNVLGARVREVAAEDREAEGRLGTTGYRDLATAWHWRRLHPELAAELRAAEPLVW